VATKKTGASLSPGKPPYREKIHTAPAVRGREARQGLVRTTACLSEQQIPYAAGAPGTEAPVFTAASLFGTTKNSTVWVTGLLNYLILRATFFCDVDKLQRYRLEIIYHWL